MVYKSEVICGGGLLWIQLEWFYVENVEDSRMNPSEKVGVVSVVFVSTEEEKIKNN